MQRYIKNIIFDFDDTLCQTQKYGYNLENYVAGQMGYKKMPLKLHISTWGKPLPEVADTRFPGINVEKFMNEVGKTMAEFTKLGKFDVISEKTINTLKSLKKLGYRLFILTSRTKKESSHLMKRDYILSEFINNKDFYYKEKTQYGKPDPRVFKNLLKNNNILAKECVYIGDSPSDSLAAKFAGMSFICSLESGLRKRESFLNDLVDAYIKDISELLNVIDNLTTSHKVNIIQYKEKVKFIISVAKQRISVPHDYFSTRLPEIKQLIDVLLKSNKVK